MLFEGNFIVRRWRNIISAVPIVILLFNTGVLADELTVLCPPPLRTTLTELAPLFERESGHRLLVGYEPSKAIVGHVKSGEVPDIAILTASNVDELRAQGLIEGRVDLVRSRIGIAVRTGAAAPDVSTAEAFKRTLLAAKSFARNEGADSGIYMASLLERLGIDEQMQGKTILVRSGYVAELVANGQAEIGAQQVSELMSVAGVAVFPLPPGLQHVLTFSAGVAKRPKAPDAVAAFLRFVASSAAAAVIKAKGLEPA